jgi:hypothetical protein
MPIVSLHQSNTTFVQLVASSLFVTLLIEFAVFSTASVKLLRMLESDSVAGVSCLGEITSVMHFAILYAACFVNSLYPVKNSGAIINYH